VKNAQHPVCPSYFQYKQGALKQALKKRSSKHGSRMEGFEQANGHFNNAFSGMHATRFFSLHCLDSLQPEQVSGALMPLYHTDRLE
jgi:hypothetical protein